jgi:general secretion pathway protein C
MVRYVSWLINAALFTLCCFLVADTANAIIAALLNKAPPVAVEAESVALSQSREWSERQRIIDRNLFHSSELEPEEELEETDLPLKLWGTIASLDPEQSWASIEELDERTTTAVRVGDEISRATVVQIERQRVVLLENGRRRSLSLEDADPLDILKSATSSLRSTARSRRSESRQPTARATRANPADKEARQALRDRVRKLGEDRFEVEPDADPSALLTQATFLPEVDPSSGEIGIKVSAIQPGSLLEEYLKEFGIGDGDVITEIGGVPIGEFEDPSQIPDVVRSALAGDEGPTVITINGKNGPRQVEFSGR